jgi:hypothetical protein
VSASAARIKSEIAKERERVSVTPDAKAVAALAATYSNAELGDINVSRKNAGVTIDFRSMGSVMGTRTNDDGTMSFVALDPTLLFFPLVVGTKDGKRTLTVRDSQHEFVFPNVERRMA